MGSWFHVSWFLFKPIIMKRVINKNYLLQVLLIGIYFLSIYGFPSQIINLFYQYSDKFEPHKGSDLVIIFLIINFFIGKVQEI